MRWGLGIVVLVTAAMVIALGGPWVVERVSDLHLFDVTRIEVEGGRYLAAEDVLAAAAIPAGASLWDDLDPVVSRLLTHPGIRVARADRKLPGTVVLEIEERDPVALVSTPVLVPVDGEGALLPFDPAVTRLDLPLLHAGAGGVGEGAHVRALAAEIERLRQIEPDLVASTSDVLLDEWGAVVLHLDEPKVTFRYAPPLSPRRLQEGLVVLEDALARNPDRPPVEIDLRFEDQVVVRLGQRRR